MHSEWKFKTRKNYTLSTLKKWVEPIRWKNQQFNEVNKINHGANGSAFIPTKEQILKMEKLRKIYNFNVLASDMIPYNRSLPDLRPHQCRNLIYPNRLPTTSVIIVFHNEIWSTLLRSIWSIINRSPHELVAEIILVDDASTFEFLKLQLSHYIQSLSFPIKIIRTKKREGLIRARLIGTKHAKVRKNYLHRISLTYLKQQKRKIFSG